MEIIRHRVNTIEEIKGCPRRFGVEIDLRSSGQEIILDHDPFKKGILFHEWIKFFNHSFLILNVKEDGLEEKIMHYLELNQISDYFFLDQPFPTLKASLDMKLESAIRISEFENLKSVPSFRKTPNFVWMDSFFRFNILNYDFEEIKNLNLKVCLVSPELQGRNYDEIIHIKESFSSINYRPWGVCTKRPELWVD